MKECEQSVSNEHLLQRKFFEFYENHFENDHGHMASHLYSTNFNNGDDTDSYCRPRWPAVYSNVLTKICPKTCSSNVCSNNEHSSKINLANFHRALRPCVYDKKRDEILCLGNNFIDLKNILQDISQNVEPEKKHFKSFQLSNSKIESLDSSTFSKVTFDEIHIYRCPQLQSIANDAFNGTDRVTTVLSIKFNPKLKFPGYSLFDMINKFSRLTNLTLGIDNVPVVPPEAFKPTNDQPSKLKEIVFMNNYGVSSWKTISSNAFKSNAQLTKIAFFGVSLDSIEEYAFATESTSMVRLSLDFTNCMGYNINAFKRQSLAHIRRPVTLLLGTSRDETHQKIVRYIDENVFKDFLTEKNDSNDSTDNYRSLDLFNSPLNCSDCRNAWLNTASDSLRSAVLALKCTDGKRFEDHFEECHRF